MRPQEASGLRNRYLDRFLPERQTGPTASNGAETASPPMPELQFVHEPITDLSIPDDAACASFIPLPVPMAPSHPVPLRAGCRVRMTLHESQLVLAKASDSRSFKADCMLRMLIRSRINFGMVEGRSRAV